jgi:hypothetical protein
MFYSNADVIFGKTQHVGALWLGNYKAALDLKFLLENDISVIINCTPDIPYIHEILKPDDLSKIKSLETFRISVYDSTLDHDIYLMEQYLHTVLPFLIKKLIKEKKNVLIHCHQGVQRSACVVAALLYIIKHDHLLKYEPVELNKIENTPDDNQLMKNVINFMLKRRPKVFTFGYRINFKNALERFFNITIH